MEKISKIKSIIEEGERINSFFKDYGYTKDEYESLHPEQPCDGYAPGLIAAANVIMIQGMKYASVAQ